MKPSRMAGLALLALASACSRPTKPFAIPDLKQVQYVQVSQIEGTSTVWEHEIRDPRRIAPILAHFREHNRGYRTATFLGEMLSRDRVQIYAVSFSGDDGVPLIIWVGPDWLGGIDKAVEFDGEMLERDRPLSASEREALLALIRERDPMGRVIP